MEKMVHFKDIIVRPNQSSDPKKDYKRIKFITGTSCTF